MIKSFRHKGIQKFYEKGDSSGIQPKHISKIRFQLAVLDTAKRIEDCDVPGYRLHPLRGNRKGEWAIIVSSNWRLTFRFIDGHVHILNYEDYH